MNILEKFSSYKGKISGDILVIKDIFGKKTIRGDDILSVSYVPGEERSIYEILTSVGSYSVISTSEDFETKLIKLADLELFEIASLGLVDMKRWKRRGKDYVNTSSLDKFRDAFYGTISPYATFVKFLAIGGFFVGVLVFILVFLSGNL